MRAAIIAGVAAAAAAVGIAGCASTPDSSKPVAVHTPSISTVTAPAGSGFQHAEPGPAQTDVSKTGIPGLLRKMHDMGDLEASPDDARFISRVACNRDPNATARDQAVSLMSMLKDEPGNIYTVDSLTGLLEWAGANTCNS